MAIDTIGTNAITNDAVTAAKLADTNQTCSGSTSDAFSERLNEVVVLYTSPEVRSLVDAGASKPHWETRRGMFVAV